MSKYARARADFEYLESIVEVADLVEVDAQVFDLMQEPTKARAAEMYADCIDFWFSEHRTHHDDDYKVRRIRKRWGV